ncbi:MAG: hypothetical protein R3314_01280 [Longimicrobiales bacterium]|nr:hypothetical protein [Longimicrobiales bacterium]
MPAAAPLEAAAQAPELEDRALAVAYRYETLVRERAPYRAGGFDGECDEWVGRFCLRFGDGADAEPDSDREDPDVTEARRRVVRAYREWLSVDPGDPEAAGGLVRYLIADGRPGEAVPPARTHAWAAPGPTGLLLLGLALHHAGDFVAAETAFDSARSLSTPEDRLALDDVRVLLTPAEADRYRDLDPAGREAYNRRFWAFSDPFLTEPGNERRSAHYARHAWIRILDDGPRGRGALAWGGDHEELVLRYGVPTRSEQVRRPPFRLAWSRQVIRRYPPDAVSFVPRALLTEGIPLPPPPGAPSPLERDTAESAYQPVTLPRVRGLDVQVSRIPTADGWILRVDASLSPDTLPRHSAVRDRPRPDQASPVGVLALFDTLGTELARAPARVGRGPGGATVLRAESPLPRKTSVFQAEVTDPTAGRGGRALYRVERPDAPLALSDPVLAPVPRLPLSPSASAPLPDSARGPEPVLPSETVPLSDQEGRFRLRPFPATVLAVDRMQVWVAVRGLARSGGRARYVVEWWLEPPAPSGLSAAVHWLGRTLGLAEERMAARIRWETVAEAEDPLPITFAVDLEGVDPGSYTLFVRIRDPVSGRVATSSRPLLLEAAPRAR